jgi:hypothetical protein
VAETTVKRLLCCGFRRNVGGEYGEKYMVFFFQVRISHVLKHNRPLKVAVQGLDFMTHPLYIHTSHVLRFISICDLFTDSPSYQTAISHTTSSHNLPPVKIRGSHGGYEDSCLLGCDAV